MKIRKLICAAIASVCALSMSAQLPGPAIAGSVSLKDIPAKAQKQIADLCKDVKVKSVIKDFADQEYEIRLANGVKLEYDNQGTLLEIDAPSGRALNSALVKKLLPSKSYDRLRADNLTGNVESIEFKNGRAIEVEILRTPQIDAYIFDINGELIIIED